MSFGRVRLLLWDRGMVGMWLNGKVVEDYL